MLFGGVAVSKAFGNIGTRRFFFVPLLLRASAPPRDTLFRSHLIRILLMKYRAALFDFDGTLTPSLPLWVKALRIAAKSLGHEFSDEELIRRFFYRNWTEVARELEVESFEVLQREIHRGLQIAFCDAVLFPQVVTILEQCRAQRVKTALVTSAPRIVLNDAMPRLGLESLFDYVVCADDVTNFKPHPEPLLMTLSALRCEPEQSIMIGDSTADILAGKAAGTATALYMTDAHDAFHHADTLRATEPDHIFVDHGELPEILGLT
jgi:pyrophosphatase PpaX